MSGTHTKFDQSKTQTEICWGYPYFKFNMLDLFKNTW